jgi:uncharacterized protein
MIFQVFLRYFSGVGENKFLKYRNGRVTLIDGIKKTRIICRRTLSITLCVLGLLLIAISADAVETFPKPVGAVNDFAGVIPAQYKTRMEDLSREVLQKTGTSIVVATVTSIGDNDTEGYVNRLYQAWGIGKKGEDKGVLIFLAVSERRVRMETGYGVEGILPDGLIGELLDKHVVPYLKQNDYGKGLSNAMMAVAAVIAKDADVSLTGRSAVDQPKREKTGRVGSLLPLILLILIMIPLLGTRQGRDMIPWLLLLFLSGGGGGRGGGFGGFGGGGFGGFGGGGSGGGGAGRDF